MAWPNLQLQYATVLWSLELRVEGRKKASFVVCRLSFILVLVS